MKRQHPRRCRGRNRFPSQIVPRERRNGTPHGRLIGPHPLREVPELPPYTFDEHQRRYGHLPALAQLGAFVALPAWQRRAAWDALRAELEWERQ